MRRHGAAKIGVLAWIAGQIDTFGYLSLGQVFVTHMTGNTGVLAISIVEGRWAEALHRGVVIPFFVVGAACGAAMVEASAPPRQVARAFAAEALLLVVLAAIGWGGGGALPQSEIGRVLMLALLAVAMGIQNAALPRRGVRGVHTTHVTGPLTELARNLVRGEGRRAGERRRRVANLAARNGGFALGALTGALSFAAMPLLTPLLSAAVLLAIGAMEVRRAGVPTGG